MLEGIDASLWRKIMRWFSRTRKEREKEKEEIETAGSKRKKYANEYMKQKGIKTDKDLIKAIGELEGMSDEEMDNVERGILLAELRKEYLAREMNRR